MKNFFSILLAIILIFTLVIGVIIAAAFIFIQSYYKPTPAAFEFYCAEETIESVEVVTITKKSDTEFEIAPVKTVEDKDAFLKDFKSLSCKKGFSLDSLATVSTAESISAIRFNYSNGSYEVVTPYGNLDSGLLNSNFAADELVKEDYFFFEEKDFSQLVNKYSN